MGWHECNGIGEIEDLGEGKGGRDICPKGTKDCLWIERRQTLANRKIAVYKVKMENSKPGGGSTHL